MLFAIEAYESQYQGLHGIVDYAIVEENSTEEVLDYAYYLSEQVIYSYGLEPEPDSEDWESGEDCAEAWAEMIRYSVWKIPNTKGKTIEELEEEFYNTPDEFIKNYCVDI